MTTIELIKEVKRARIERIRATWRVFKSNKAAYVSFYILVALYAMAIVGTFYKPHDPYRIDLSKALQPPSIQHPLGTDWLGRDLLSRIMEGARYTLGISLAAVLLGATIGTILGLISGFVGGLVDSVIQRITDALLAFPTLLLAIGEGFDIVREGGGLCRGRAHAGQG